MNDIKNNFYSFKIEPSCNYSKYIDYIDRHYRAYMDIFQYVFECLQNTISLYSEFRFSKKSNKDNPYLTLLDTGDKVLLSLVKDKYPKYFNDKTYSSKQCIYFINYAKYTFKKYVLNALEIPEYVYNTYPVSIKSIGVNYVVLDMNDCILNIHNIDDYITFLNIRDSGSIKVSRIRPVIHNDITEYYLEILFSEEYIESVHSRIMYSCYQKISDKNITSTELSRLLTSPYNLIKKLYPDKIINRDFVYFNLDKKKIKSDTIEKERD